MIGPLLGQGAMGDVYEAWDIVLARPVALKILQHMEPAAMIRFMHEAQLHARLDTRTSAGSTTWTATDGTPRIAMQLIRGPHPGGRRRGPAAWRRWWASWPRWPRRSTAPTA